MHFLESEDTAQLKCGAVTLFETAPERSVELRERNQQIINARAFAPDDDVDLSQLQNLIEEVINSSRTILPEDTLPLPSEEKAKLDTEFWVRRRTALACAREMADAADKPLVLNFADGLGPGVIPNYRQRTQEELNCRASALFECLQGSTMYSENRRRGIGGDYSDTCTLTAGVPVFRDERGKPLSDLYRIDFLSCAAPMRDEQDPDRTNALLKTRIARVLEVARSAGYESLVLGAWGCGGCGNDPNFVAFSFYQLLTTDFDGAFKRVSFAIADPTENRQDLRRGKIIEPFKDFFCADRRAQINRINSAYSERTFLLKWIQNADEALRHPGDPQRFINSLDSGLGIARWQLGRGDSRRESGSISLEAA